MIWEAVIVGLAILMSSGRFSLISLGSSDRHDCKWEQNTVERCPANVITLKCKNCGDIKAVRLFP